MIYDLMDHSKFKQMSLMKSGPLVHIGSMDRKISINTDDKDNRLGLHVAPFRGKYFHEVFGYGKSGVADPKGVPRATRFGSAMPG